jgi:glutaredoxin-related protein
MSKTIEDMKILCPICETVRDYTEEERIQYDFKNIKPSCICLECYEKSKLIKTITRKVELSRY